MANKLIEWYPQIASKYHVSVRVIEILAELLQRSKGEEARFDIPELGGKGIWKAKHGAQIGNGFNQALNQRAGDLCTEIANHLRLQDYDETTIVGTLEETISIMPVSIEPPSASIWWEAHLGNEPDLMGNVGTMRYAYFLAKNRLVLRANLRNRLFDTTGIVIKELQVGRAVGFFNTIIVTDTGEIPISKLREVVK